MAVIMGIPLLLAACGSSSASAKGTSTNTSSPASVALACQQVAGVLADGPDPDADPVGYALAQVLPLRGVQTSDVNLKKAIGELAAAYEAVDKSNAAPGTALAVTRANKAVDKICPGATS